MTDSMVPTFNKGRAWLIAIVGLIAGLGMGMVTFKAMTTASLMVDYFDTDWGTYASITSIIASAAIVAAIPSGAILNKLGPRRLAILVMAVGVFTAVIQPIIAPYVDYTTFMLCGIGGSFVYGLMAVYGPMLVSAWFPPEKRGLPLSISGACFSVAMLVVLMVSPVVFQFYLDPSNTATGGVDPQAFITISWILCAVMAIGLILTILFVRMPPEENNFLFVGTPQGEKGKLVDGFKIPSVWLLILIFLGFGFMVASYGNYYTSGFLVGLVEEGGVGLDATSASYLASIGSYVSLAVNLIWGFVLNKIPNRRYGMLSFIITILLGLCSILMFAITNPALIAVYMVYYGIVSQLYSPVCYAMIPELTDNPAQFSAAVGAINLASQVAGIGATAVIGNVRAAFGGWGSLVYIMVVFAIIAVVAGLALMPMYKKKYAARHAEEPAAA